MAEVPIEKAPQKAKDLFNRGFTAFERGNLPYAIDMLMACLEVEPGLLKARKFLRGAEIQQRKQKSSSAISDAILTAKTMPGFLAATALVKANKNDQAVLATEKLLKVNPLDPRFVLLFAQAAANAGLPEAAIQTLEIARDHHPTHIKIINWLGALYQKTGRTKSARECFETLCEICPNDPDALKTLKDAMAIDSMSTDGWQEASESGGTYRDIMKDEDEAHLLEQESKAVQSESDTDELIANTLKKFEAEPENINYCRQLSKLYSQKREFGAALEWIKKGIAISPGDPELEKTLTTVRIETFDFEAEQLAAEGKTEESEAKRLERDQFVADDLQERVAKYPNDSALRYEWGSLLFRYEHINDAIQQFQLSQRNPKHRAQSLYKLAMCFKHKKQYDLAIEQLEKAGTELNTMNESKKDICYELGLIAEMLGDPEKAAGYYKQIYQVDIGYKDIAQKVEQVYDK